MFEDNGLGTSPGWDSNKVILQAVDPTINLINAKVLVNENTYGISRFIFKVETWCGGLASTAKFISGKFADLDSYINTAQAPSDLQIQVSGVNNKLDFSDFDGAINSSIELSASINDKANFNYNSL